MTVGVVAVGECSRQFTKTKFIPEIGRKFGRWTVVGAEVKKGSFNSKSESRSAYWLVKCECGQVSWRGAAALLKGTTNGCKSCCRNTNGENSRMLSFLRKIRYQAADRGIVFEEDVDCAFIEDLFNKQNRKCAISGVPISFLDKWVDKKGFTCSLDRKDSSKPYSRENVHLVHKTVNTMKWTLSVEEFLWWAKAIHENNLEFSGRFDDAHSS